MLFIISRGYIGRWACIQYHLRFNDDSQQLLVMLSLAPLADCSTDFTILSNKLPHHGASYKLKIHWTFFSARYCLTTRLFIKSTICLEADLKALPLSDTIFDGNPLLAVNLAKLLEKASAVRSVTM